MDERSSSLLPPGVLAAPALNPSARPQGLRTDANGEKWFTELCTLWPGQGLSLRVKEILFQQRSKFQVRTHTQSLSPHPGATHM